MVQKKINLFHRGGGGVDIKWNGPLQEQLRAEQQQVMNLQTRLETSEAQIRTMEQQLTNLRGDLAEQQRARTTRPAQRTGRGRLTSSARQEQQPRMQRQRVMRELRAMTEQGIGAQNWTNDNSRDWVINRHEIERTSVELGRGGWGVVFRGKFRRCDVAVKEMYENILSPENRQLFEREVDIASKCRHPCLLQFIGATTDERPLLVTEIMECSLRARLDNRGDRPLSEQEISVISLDVARALNYLHGKAPPIIHSDISSANVLLWRQGNQWRGKVSDYGTANFVRQSTRNNAGAPTYCAPEFLHEVRNQPISCKVSYTFNSFE